MSFRPRNVDGAADDPVESWPFEALVTALERGGITEWRRIAAAIRSQPWGGVARSVEDYLSYERPAGVAALMERTIRNAREEREAAERAEVAAQIRQLVESSGLTRAGFAAAIGTSASRLSTYCTGKVVPSAALMVRIRAVSGSETIGR